MIRVSLVPLRAVALLFAGCAGNGPDRPAEPMRPPAAHLGVREAKFPGARLLVEGGPFLAAPAGTTTVRFEGTFAAAPRSFDWPAVAVDSQAVTLALSPEVLGRLGPGAGVLAGRLFVTVAGADDPTNGATAVTSLTLDVKRQPAPALFAPAMPPLPPGGHVPLTGGDFLDPEEGGSRVELSGAFLPDAPDSPARTIVDRTAPIVSRTDRQHAEVALPAGLFGLSPGVFRGKLRLVDTSAEGHVYEGPWVEAVALRQTGPRMLVPPPFTLSRGESVTVPIWGALPADGPAQTASYLALVGRFTGTYPDGRPFEIAYDAAHPLLWAPDDVPDSRTLRLALRTTPGPMDAAPGEGVPVGLGTQPGHFEGSATLIVLLGRERVVTAPAPFVFDVGPARQAVYLDYTAGFDEGLRLFGLEAAREAVIARIHAVCERDFAGLRVRFVETPPADTLEFTTIELGGRDPNHLDLLGLENTAQKDVGNLRLDERVGGRNAEAAALGEPAYGGIFVSSFLTLSPHADAPSVLAEPAFDAIFAPFAAVVSDTPEETAPYDPAVDTPETPRGQAATEAVRVLGNLLGSTVTHELGHALGLSAVPGEVHNPGDWPGDLMDRGSARPLAERAELDGTPPGRFTGPNELYLRRLLGEPSSK